MSLDRVLAHALIVVATAAAAAASAPPAATKAAGPRIAFERDGWVWVAALDGRGATKVTEGVDPCLAPDGRRIAYTLDTSPAGGVRRHIAVVDLATHAGRVLASVPGDNAFGPVWSPDGSSLLVNVLTENGWAIGLVRADDTSFRFVFKPGPDRHSWWGAVFAPDGASFYCQDLDEIARFSFEGKKLWSAAIAKLFPGAGLNSGARLSPSPDGTALLVDADMDEDTTVKEWDGPPPSVFRTDLASTTATRVTPKGALVWEPQWLDASSFLATTLGPNDKEPSIVRVPFAGDPPVVVVTDARAASVVAPVR